MVEEEKYVELCHWCELVLWRHKPENDWIDNYGSEVCEFHPASYDSKTLERWSEVKAPHQVLEEVEMLIREAYWRSYILSNAPKKEPKVQDNVIHLSKRASRTQREAAKRMLPRSGSMRARVYDAIKNTQYEGMTDAELEKYLRGKHQTISSSRRSLVIDGFIFDSGKTRKNSEGFECTVWVEKEFQFSPYLNGF